MYKVHETDISIKQLTHNFSNTLLWLIFPNTRILQHGGTFLSKKSRLQIKELILTFISCGLKIRAKFVNFLFLLNRPIRYLRNLWWWKKWKNFHLLLVAVFLYIHIKRTIYHVSYYFYVYSNWWCDWINEIL